ncbi:YcaO-like family protein [Candidatus Kaiserbacteria bacterium]|nr:YcaO-like family protein [Candidatus Kaiserbacteria bacterium]MCB9811542.1 YcaO-like family protein [Candidatus Nomurabacteria bacterium]
MHDTLLLTEIIRKRRQGFSDDAKLALITFIEKYFNASVTVDANYIPYGRTDLIPLFSIAQQLIEAKLIKNYRPITGYHDEPLQYHWAVTCGTHDNQRAGGMSIDSDYDAFIAALAEAVERYLWFEDTSYFKKPMYASINEMQKKSISFISPDQITGVSKEQREKYGRLSFAPDSKFTWTLGQSWTTGKQLYLPAQLVNSCRDKKLAREPILLMPITTGLATWPTREGAVLAGALEVIERDAYMILWLNQLKLPRLNLLDLAHTSPKLQRLLELCKKYQLEPSAIRMVTDAPTYAICASLKDTHEHVPAFTVGLKAHNSLSTAVEGALLEALRIRQTIRNRQSRTGKQSVKRDGSKLNHLERLDYWAEPQQVSNMYFLSGTDSSEPNPSENWEADSESDHLRRIVNWARNNNYELCSVSVGSTKRNVSPWNIEMVVMPDLQPMHQNERVPYVTGKRLSAVPEKFGYQSLPTPFTAYPHPFA